MNDQSLRLTYLVIKTCPEYFLNDIIQNNTKSDWSLQWQHGKNSDQQSDVAFTVREVAFIMEYTDYVKNDTEFRKLWVLCNDIKSSDFANYSMNVQCPNPWDGWNEKKMLQYLH